MQLSQKGNETRDPRYSYGWQRAEILGALINGVFLLALCFSIFMEAIERFVNVTEVQNPRLVVIVGTLGLASNIVGLFLFHDHGHSHGHSHSHDHDHDHQHASNQHSDSHTHDHEEQPSDARAFSGKRKASQRKRERSESAGSLLGHPAATRAYVVRTAHDLGYDASGSGSGAAETSDEREALLTSSHSYGATSDEPTSRTRESSHQPDLESGDNIKLKSKKSGFIGRLMGKKEQDGHSHSHGQGEGSMNMQGVFLHVLGDALGNVGVIASGLFIAFSSVWWRYYTDPAISFLITVIIFHSALPLVKSASFILLQGVPSAVPLEKVHQSLLEVKGVLSVHELHIWQLSEAKNVASVHVLIDVDEANLTDQSSGHASSDEGAGNKNILIPQEHRYMDIAAQIRGKLHQYNIHSSTIQPEFVRGGMRSVAKAQGVEIDEHVTNAVGKLVTKNGELVERTISRNGSSACLIACGPDGSCVESACCPPLSENASGKSSPAHDDGHGH